MRKPKVKKILFRVGPAFHNREALELRMSDGSFEFFHVSRALANILNKSALVTKPLDGMPMYHELIAAPVSKPKQEAMVYQVIKGQNCYALNNKQFWTRKELTEQLSKYAHVIDIHVQECTKRGKRYRIIGCKCHSNEPIVSTFTRGDWVSGRKQKRISNEATTSQQDS